MFFLESNVYTIIFILVTLVWRILYYIPAAVIHTRNPRSVHAIRRLTRGKKHVSKDIRVYLTEKTLITDGKSRTRNDDVMLLQVNEYCWLGHVYNAMVYDGRFGGASTRFLTQSKMFTRHLCSRKILDQICTWICIWKK